MLVGAIVVVGQRSPEHRSACDSVGTAPGMSGGSLLACLDLLGKSVLDRIVQRLQHDGVKLITVVIRDEDSHQARTAASNIRAVPSRLNLWSAAECAVREYVQHGVELVLLTRLGPYTELDLGDLIRFHREANQGVTTITKQRESLDSWLIEASEVHKMRRVGLPVLLGRESMAGTLPFSVPGYVGRLEDVTGLRRLVVDAFLSRCSIRPKGREISPGVWFDEGAHAHRRARVVAPAYVGRGTQLHADTLVTQFSNVERGCYIHAGTVIEDASVLANTYVGKGLNVAHAIVDGNTLRPLGHNIVVEIPDGKLLGRTVPTVPSGSAAGGSSVSLAEHLLATAWN
jgi:NDP-sugar pyrophosphorylase family protein